jgi:hypothetical protein
MNAIRKFVIACLATLALLGPVALPSQYQAPGSSATAAQTRYYYVYYRSCPSDYWHYYGYYTRASDANQAVRWFNYYGYQAYYR